MFDLVTGRAVHAPRPQGAPLLLSVVAHAAVIGGLFLATILLVSPPPPRTSTMMAFVAAVPPAPPAPPPASPPKPSRPKPAAAPVPAPSEMAPIQPPPKVEIPAALEDAYEAELGVEGGVPGGIREGVLAGLRAEIPEDPPPAPAPATPPPGPAPPLRVGGGVQPPALIERVEPVYPPAASATGLEGRVILEAIVDEEGRVIDLRVLRSAGLFDKPALAAVRQWRYAPLLLNGRPVKFILTVVLSFTLQR